MPSSKILQRLAATVSHLKKPSSVQHIRSTATMATAATVSLTADTAGVLHVPLAQISPDASSKASELLQKNHDEYHMYCQSSSELNRERVG